MKKVLGVVVAIFFWTSNAIASDWSWSVGSISLVGEYTFPLRIWYYNSYSHSIKIRTITFKGSGGNAIRTLRLDRIVKGQSEVNIKYTLSADSWMPIEKQVTSATLDVDYNYGKPKPTKQYKKVKKKSDGFKWWYLLFIPGAIGILGVIFGEDDKSKKQVRNKSAKEPSKPDKKPEPDKEQQANLGMTGTAFFIDDKGHLITNFHVVANSGNRLKIFHNGEQIKTKIIARDEALDLALLKTSIKSKYYIEISDKSLQKMQSIVAAGYPAMHLSDDLKFTSGIISSLKGFGNNSALIQIDAALNAGNSGGPIIDRKDGHLAAVAVARMEGGGYQSVNYGIKASRVKEFIESENITIPSKTKKGKRKKKDINLVLENSTVLIFH